MFSSKPSGLEFMFVFGSVDDPQKHLLQGGPLPVVNRVATLFIGVK